MQVIESKDTWNGMPVLQFDFLMTADANPKELGCGNVRVLVSAKKNCAPHVKWVWSGTKRQGWAATAYRWLVEKFGQPLRVSDVCGEESIAFHRRMKKLGLVSKFEMDPVFKMPKGASRSLRM